MHMIRDKFVPLYFRDTVSYEDVISQGDPTHLSHSESKALQSESGYNLPLHHFQHQVKTSLPVAWLELRIESSAWDSLSLSVKLQVRTAHTHLCVSEEAFHNQACCWLFVQLNQPLHSQLYYNEIIFCTPYVARSDVPEALRCV